MIRAAIDLIRCRSACPLQVLAPGTSLRADLEDMHQVVKEDLGPGICFFVARSVVRSLPPPARRPSIILSTWVERSVTEDHS